MFLLSIYRSLSQSNLNAVLSRVDVYRGDPVAPSNGMLQEKIITIRGQPENCINACREILKVMKTDAENKSKPK